MISDNHSDNQSDMSSHHESMHNNMGMEDSPMMSCHNDSDEKDNDDEHSDHH
ncbi:hypothetical protein CHISP_3678 [Chitinispirillum alkaliphilum]|nr:hypothetical protein CHISP_3678 [Chitinispirillum alkaliphilum]